MNTTIFIVTKISKLPMYYYCDEVFLFAYYYWLSDFQTFQELVQRHCLPGPKLTKLISSHKPDILSGYGQTNHKVVVYFQSTGSQGFDQETQATLRCLDT